MRPALAAQLLCAVCAILIIAGITPGTTPAHAAIPIMLAVIIALEYPPPGKGVGKPAAPLSKLDFVTDPRPLRSGGVLDGGVLHVLVFWRSSKPCHKALPRLERLWRRCAALLPGKVRFIILASKQESRESLDAFATRWEGQVTMTLAHDSSGAAEEAYMQQHCVYSLPHAFVVPPGGIISWHGNANQRDLIHNVEKQLWLLINASSASASQSKAITTGSPNQTKASLAEKKKKA